MAITPPAGTTVRAPSIKNHYAGVVRWEALTVERTPVIPATKFAAVRTQLNAAGPRNSLLISNAMPFAVVQDYPTAKGYRIKFAAAKTDAEVDTFLAAVETAVTT